MAAPISRRDLRGAPLSTIAAELGGADAAVTIVGDGSTRVRDVQQDSRKITGGELFVARAGSADEAQVARFTLDAIARGAAAVMRARERPRVPLSVPCLELPEHRLRAALGMAASTVLGHPSYVVEVLAITGTNGKTTTSFLLADALDRLARARGEGVDCAVIGTVGARLGDEERATTHTTPEGDELARLIAWARDEGARHVALEASSHALEQGRLAGTRIRAAAFTNLTQDHLDYHLTMERYFEAKRRLFVELHPGVSAIWIDDPYGARLADEVETPRLRVGTSSNADVRIVRSTCDRSGIHAELSTPSGAITLDSKLIGAHNLANLTLALAVMIGLGIPAVDAAAALAEARAAPGRLQLVSDPARDDVTVLVDYAHTPDALSRILAAVRPLSTSRLICVFGCGGDRDQKKRAPMGRAVVLGADVGIVTSDNPRTEDPVAIVADILVGASGEERLDEAALAHAKKGVHVEIDREKAIERAIRSAVAGDVIVVAGKGHEDYQIIGNDKRPFDDVKEAQRALVDRRARAGGG